MENSPLQAHDHQSDSHSLSDSALDSSFAGPAPSVNASSLGNSSQVSQLRSLQAAANASGRVSQLKALQRAANNSLGNPVQRMSAMPPSSAPMQLLTDKAGKEVTAEMVEKETDISVLKDWQENGEYDWDDEVAEKVLDRILVLEKSQKEEAEKEKAKKEEERKKKELDTLTKDMEQRAGVKLPNFDAELYDKFSNIGKGRSANFFKICLQDSVDAEIIYKKIEDTSTSLLSFKRGMEAFADGAPLASVLRLVEHYDMMVGLTMHTISADLVEKLLSLGVVKVSGHDYCDTPLKKGSVYVLNIELTRDRIKPEWHVHWGPRNKVDAASFKDVRMKVGAGSRVSTEGQDNIKLKKLLCGL